MVPDLGSVDASGGLDLIVPERRATEVVISELADVLSRHRGASEVRLRLTKGQVAKVFEVPYPVKVSADLYGELKSLLGPGCLG
jgi:DNA polymerase-3 subunit alpha